MHLNSLRANATETAMETLVRLRWRWVKDHDEYALECLLARLRPAIWRFALRRLERDGECDARLIADDATQEALIRVHARLDAFRGTTDAEFITWVLAIARTTVIDRFRQELRRRPWNVQGDAAESLLAAQAYRRWMGIDTDGASIGLRILLRVLDVVLSSLAPESVGLLRLRLESALTWPTIAEQIGTTPDGARRRFQRMQKTLRRAILKELQTLSLEEQRFAQSGLGRAGSAGGGSAQPRSSRRRRS
jgi:RNA polymerase sigma factor (sigma-70 family)